jgi:hypothetical protein
MGKAKIDEPLKAPVLNPDQAGEIAAAIAVANAEPAQAPDMSGFDRTPSKAKGRQNNRRDNRRDNRQDSYATSDDVAKLGKGMNDMLAFAKDVQKENVKAAKKATKKLAALSKNAKKGAEALKDIDATRAAQFQAFDAEEQTKRVRGEVHAKTERLPWGVRHLARGLGVTSGTEAVLLTSLGIGGAALAGTVAYDKIPSMGDGDE